MMETESWTIEPFYKGQVNAKHKSFALFTTMEETVDWDSLESN
jgi:hypothetical protein